MTPIGTELQRTLASSASCRGVGLFSGRDSSVVIRPAPADHGVVFCRVDLPGQPRIPALARHAITAPRRTALRVGDATIELTEHCLSALLGLGIDNALIELDAPELPAGDGSAELFVGPILAAGLVDQPAPRRPLVVTQPITLTDGEATITASPDSGRSAKFGYSLDYGPGAPIPAQSFGFQADPMAYAREVAPARTFSTLDEARAAQAGGLFRHLTPRDMLVLGPDGPVDNVLRFADEPARHKLLDLMGDLALVGRPIRGRIDAYRSGHGLNLAMVRALLTHAGEE